MHLWVLYMPAFRSSQIRLLLGILLPPNPTWLSNIPNSLQKINVATKAFSQKSVFNNWDRHAFLSKKIGIYRINKTILEEGTLKDMLLFWRIGGVSQASDHSEYFWVMAGKY